jgi:alkaline phosphatase D
MADKKVLRLAFGSCNNEEKGQEYSHEINQYFSNSQGPGYPAAWIWAGDIVYADTNDLGEMQAAYDRVKNGAYRAFQQDCEKVGYRVVGIWDDHDFGGDNLVGAGEDGAPFLTLGKQRRKALLVNFLGQPTKTMLAGHEQIYAAYDFDRDGVYNRLILLDLRYDRQDPGPKARVIGAMAVARRKPDG